MTPQEFRHQIERTGIRFVGFYNYLQEQMLTNHLQQLESRRLVRVSEDEIDNFIRLHADRLQAATPLSAGPHSDRRADTKLSGRDRAAAEENPGSGRPGAQRRALRGPSP